MAIVPSSVKKALHLLGGHLTSPLRLDEVAAECEVTVRTLQRHFRQFLGSTPRRTRQDARFENARRQLLQARSDESVTSIASRCGFGHMGRFAKAYSRHYGETPSATLKRRIIREHRIPSVVSPFLDRPIVAIHPLAAIGDGAQVGAAVVDVLTAALVRSHWITVGPPLKAKYHLKGRLRIDAAPRYSIYFDLSDAVTGRCVWANRWSGRSDGEFGIDEDNLDRIVATVGTAIHTLETQRASVKTDRCMGVWELIMKAFPRALTLNAAAQEEALELLHRAITLAPHDPLPIALAAWCHAQRGTHHFTNNAMAEKKLSKEFVQKAARLNASDARIEALLGAAETLAHDLEAGATHCAKSLALDGGCAWGWLRSGFVDAYRGRSADATECFRIARTLAPNDPLMFSSCIGLGVAEFEIGSFDRAVYWWTRLLAEHPSAVWGHRFIAPAYLLAGKKDEARRSFDQLVEAYPDLTIRDVRSALPHTHKYMDRACEGLKTLGLSL